MTTLGNFTAGDVLTAADLNAIGTWSDFTPSYLNFSATTSFARYCQINDIVFINLQAVLTSTVGSTMYIDDMPVNGNSGSAEGLYAVARDITVNNAYQSYQIQFSGSTAIRFWGSIGGTGVSAWAGSYPFTWASGDNLWIRGFYRAA